jgi:hypothetical protein
MVAGTLKFRQVDGLIHKHTFQLGAYELARDFCKLFGVACDKCGSEMDAKIATFSVACDERNSEACHHCLAARQMQRAR